ncbi:tetratricopeptide repeat protein [Roseomonas eburnea]|uniref:protein O-GlcNAc transferase n=1 Tax=Neoroseomonas eburnea TaxID=1346889 RepID=A0A9X9X8R5_9PROT|nr:tetratricopeptide repeat protein [Neoroseomonas eburnea]MBR0680101.1 tetratricopeptide repeat protein [Neoroseomonas eburnea]
MSPQNDRRSAALIQRAHEMFGRALALHQQGQVVAAQDIYRAILGLFPDHYDALHLLGVCALQQGQHQAGVDLIQKSLAYRPDNAQAQANLGNGLRQLGRHERALRCYEKAIRLRPDMLEAHLHRAQALIDLERPAEAVASLDGLLARNRDIAPAHILRGCALCTMERLAEGLAAFDAALALAPSAAEAYLHRGGALCDLRRAAEALASFDRALALRPDLAEGHAGRGRALLALKRVEEALAAYERATALKPADATMHNGLGIALLDAGRPGPASAAFRRAIALAPDLAEAHCNLGIALTRLLRFEAAAAACGEAIALRPRYREALLQRGNALLRAGRPDRALRDLEEARRIDPSEPFLPGQILHARMQVADWSGHEEMVAELLDAIRQGRPASSPFDLLAATDSLQLQRLAAEAFVAERYPATADVPLPAVPRSADVIRVGYVSSDFGNHPVTHLMLDVLQRHDRRRFEVHALSLVPAQAEPWQDKVRAAVTRFHDLSALGDQEAIRYVRDLGIDIAVDLNGHTLGARTRLFAARIAPVQVGYLGFIGTMGAGYIDYVVADETTIPAAHFGQFREKVIHLPHFQANCRHLDAAPAAPDRAASGLPDRGTVFCSFNNAYKVTPETFDAWMRIMAQVPGSVLWLYAGKAESSGTYRTRARKLGIDPQRIVFAGFVPLAEHLARHALADLFLDTFPYNGGTTASNALRMGLPVLTRMGESFASRMGASLLGAVGMPELAVASLQDYERMATGLGNAPERVAELKRRLAANLPSCPLFDADRATEALERAFAAIHARAAAKLAPDHIAIAG